LAEGQSIKFSDLDLTDILNRLNTVDLTTPVYPFAAGELEFIADVREGLRVAPEPDSSQGPLTLEAHMVEWLIRRRLELYVEPDHQRAGRLYVLEFQGPWQYVMFGHSTNLLRRVTDHQLAAAPHGFALVNGWASPWVDNAQQLETQTLLYGGLLHHWHYRERFFKMSFEMGLKITRLVFEKLSDWRSRSGGPS